MSNSVNIYLVANDISSHWGLFKGFIALQGRKREKKTLNIAQGKENILQFHYMLRYLMILENKFQLLCPMHSLHGKQSKATLNTKESWYLSLLWICLLKYVFMKQTCSQDQAVYHAVLLANAISKNN